MDLLTAKRAFAEARRTADATYLDLLDAGEKLDRARSEFEVTQAIAAYRAAGIAHAGATERAKEARRMMANLMAGLAANGGRASSTP